ATLTLPNVLPAEQGNYSVMVSNTFGCVTSAVARLAVEVRPALQVQTAGTNVTVCWADSGTPYILEESASLLGPWSDVTEAPRTAEGALCISAPTGGTARFYRLRADAQ